MQSLMLQFFHLTHSLTMALTVNIINMYVVVKLWCLFIQQLGVIKVPIFRTDNIWDIFISVPNFSDR